jgi:hypothetical protein
MIDTPSRAVTQSTIFKEKAWVGDQTRKPTPQAFSDV